MKGLRFESSHVHIERYISFQNIDILSLTGSSLQRQTLLTRILLLLFISTKSRWHSLPTPSRDTSIVIRSLLLVWHQTWLNMHKHIRILLLPLPHSLELIVSPSWWVTCKHLAGGHHMRRLCHGNNWRTRVDIDGRQLRDPRRTSRLILGLSSLYRLAVGSSSSSRLVTPRFPQHIFLLHKSSDLSHPQPSL